MLFNQKVLSKSVADAMAYFGDPETTETEIFIRKFDQFFDCLNVRSLSELKPYTSVEDERLKGNIEIRVMDNTVKCTFYSCQGW